MSDDRANSNSREDVYSKAIRAGKRTYFFDVKATRGNDLYLTITESKKRFSDDGNHFYEKHKLFLYKEDFDKFIEGLQDTIDEIHHLRNGGGDGTYDQEQIAAQAAEDAPEPVVQSSFTNVNFEDLDSDQSSTLAP